MESAADSDLGPRGSSMIGGVWRPVWETGAKRPRIPHHQRARDPPEQHPVLFRSADQGSKPRFLKVEPPNATDIAVWATTNVSMSCTLHMPLWGAVS